MQEDEFITQHIAKKKQKRKELMELAGKAALAGADFALSAAAITCVTCPILAKRWRQSTEKNSAKIERDESRDEGESYEQPGSPTEAESGSREVNGEAENQNIREQVEQAIENRDYTLNDIRQMAGTLRKQADSADVAVVSVTHEQAERDWFNNALESSENYAGPTVTKTESEFLFLATIATAEGTDTVTVTSTRGDRMSVTTKLRDSATHLAVLSLPITDADRDSLAKQAVIPFGNSYRLKRGDPLFLIGSPLGMIHSVKYGFLSSARTNVSVMDGHATVYLLDVGGDTASGTWVLNADGELIGWMTDLFSETEGQSSTAISGISDLKSTIERMMSRKETAKLGIYGRQVGTTQREQGMLVGVYISRVEPDAPTYAAGVQPGDILTSLGDSKIETMHGLEGVLGKNAKGESVRLTLMRSGREKYETISVTAALADR